jgi:O-succinylbenzoate synthase
LLVLEDGDGLVGLGEAAPLPGYSFDTLAEAHADLRRLFGAPLPERDRSVPCGVALGRASAVLTSASARAALEAALLDLWSRREGVPAWALLAPAGASLSAGESHAKDAVAVAAWLPDGTQAALDAAHGAYARGARAFKVKLDAPRSLAEGLATLAALRRAFGAAVTLRADANQSATEAELDAEVKALRALELEWLEEPARAPLSKPLGVPIALDESLAGHPHAPALDAHPEVAALVLKPTSLGGLARCLELAAHAEAHGRAAVASHTLEGPLGYLAAATLALALPQRAAHGLGPYERVLTPLRSPALHPTRDELVRWREPGFALELDAALAGVVLDRTERP